MALASWIEELHTHIDGTSCIPLFSTGDIWELKLIELDIVRSPERAKRVNERSRFSKLVDGLFLPIAARAGSIETGALWLGFVIPPINQAIYGNAFPAPYFIVIALVLVNVAKLFIEFFERRLENKGDWQPANKSSDSSSLGLKTGLVLSKAVGWCSIGLALAGLLTYLFVYVRDNQ